LELQILTAINSGDVDKALSLAEDFNWLSKREDGTLKQDRERTEFEEKLKQLHLNIPWSEF
jgi:hypothetical protein